jgi:hypothetical protein
MRELPLDLRPLFDDADEIARLEPLLRPYLADDFHIVLVGPEGSGFEERHDGWDGLIGGWRAWTRPYARYEFEPRRIYELGDTVVAEGMQQATLPGGGEPIEMPDICSLWFWSGERLRRAEFHLDAERARRIAERGSG